MNKSPQPMKKIPPLAAACLVVLSLVTCAVGIGAMVGGYAPERSTRFGMAGALFGSQALWFGASVVVLGLLPLVVFARSPRAVAWLGAGLGLLLVATIALGVRAAA